jgi:hypothetical protein
VAIQIHIRIDSGIIKKMLIRWELELSIIHQIIYRGIAIKKRKVHKIGKFH